MHKMHTTTGRGCGVCVLMAFVCVCWGLLLILLFVKLFFLITFDINIAISHGASRLLSYTI